MKQLETLFGSADINSFELQADFSQALESCKNNIFNRKTDAELVSANSVLFNFGGKELPPSRFYSVLGSARIECFFSKGSANRLIVFFSGARTRNGGRDLAPFPTFSSWSWGSETNASVLCIDDPMYYNYPTLPFGWFYGTEKEDFREYVAKLVCEIARLLGVENKNITLYGRSGGGSAAIAVCGFICESSAVAINPQLDIEKYPYNESFTQITGIKKTDALFLKRNNFENIIKQNKKNTFLIVSNAASKIDYDIDVNFLSVKFGADLKYGLSCMDNLCLWQYYACGEPDPHSAFDNPPLFRMIMAVLEFIKAKNTDGAALLASFANEYWADRYELLMRKREINQKAVSRGGEIKALKNQIAEKEIIISKKNKEISDLKKQSQTSFFARLKRALKRLFKK